MKTLLFLLIYVFLAGCGQSSDDSSWVVDGCGEGNGTSARPYVVCTAGDITRMALETGAHYVLQSDIVLEGIWTPAGTRVAPFTGSFDGMGYTVSGLEVSGLADYAGFFGVINGGSVRNLRLVLAPSGVSGGNSVGGLAGRIEKASVSAVSVSGSVSGRNQIGLIAGAAVDSLISSVRTDGVVQSDGEAGGIVGLMAGTLLKNSYSLANVYSRNYAGGIAGIVKKGEVSYCYSKGDVITTDTASTRIGGIAGRAENTAFTGNIAACGMLYGQRVVNKITGEVAGYTSVNNYALDTMSVSGTQVDGDKGLPVTAAALGSDKTYSDIGWLFGVSAEKPWKSAHPMPILYFE